MRLRVVLLIAVMLACYLLPWVINPGVSLTLSGYDLGEWASLHDAVRGEQPPLLTSFLLRLPVALMALLIGFAARQPYPLSRSPKGEGVKSRILAGTAIVLIAVALLPPLEFLDYPNDPNYQQQALMAGIALVGGLIGVSGVLRRVHPIIGIGNGVAGTLAVIVGLGNAYNLMRQFSLPVSIGTGGVLLAVLFAVGPLIAGLRLRSSSRT